jgi:hypothetical protein
MLPSCRLGFLGFLASVFESLLVIVSKPSPPIHCSTTTLLPAVAAGTAAVPLSVQCQTPSPLSDAAAGAGPAVRLQAGDLRAALPGGAAAPAAGRRSSRQQQPAACWVHDSREVSERSPEEPGPASCSGPKSSGDGGLLHHAGMRQRQLSTMV